MTVLRDLLDLYPGAVIRSFPRAFVSIVAAATTATLYQLGTVGVTGAAAGAAGSGAKTAILLSVHIARRSGGNTFLQIGEGDFTARLPDLPVISGQMASYSVVDGTLPIFTFEADITMQAVAAAAAPDNIRVLGTVLEY